MPAIRQILPLLALVVSTLVISTPVDAASLEVTVTDSEGVPLENAAVFLDMPDLEAQPTGSAIMDQRNRQFLPYVLLVTPGTTVSFPNSDEIRHHVYSFSPAKRFERKLYSGSSADPVTFDKPGLVTLGCNIHDWMLGFILVNDAPQRAVTDSQGKARFDRLPEGTASVSAWHPRLGTTRLVEQESQISGESDITFALDVGPKLRREAPGLDEQRERRDSRRRR